MENAFIVQGGKPLNGTIQLEGAKNVALKVTIAALLFDEPVHFKNIPDISDIKELYHLLESVGAHVKENGETVTIDPTGLHSHEVDLLHGSKIRVSFMLFAPFIKRYGKARIPNPGGCRIGARPIDRMIDLMNAFGVKTEYDHSTGYYDATLDGGVLKGTEYAFAKKTHTGTELAIMLAAMAKGETVIKNAALEPEIDDLISFLNQSGAQIKRSGGEISILGVEHLSHKAPFSIMCDRNNAVTYAVGALATRGDILIKGAKPKHLSTFLSLLDDAGGGHEEQENGMRFFYKGPLHATDVTTAPEPGFMNDWQAPWAILMTQAEGISSIHETVFENRFGYVSELNKLGAHIEYFQPSVDDPNSLYQFDIQSKEAFKQKFQGIRIHGPTHLHGGVMSVSDLRAGAALLIGACVAEGESVVIGTDQIDRGYEYIEHRLAAVGASIRRM